MYGCFGFFDDVNIAHGVPLLDSTRGGPKSIGNVCKLTRRMARNEVMAVCREASKFSTTAIGLDENISMANARVVDGCY